MARTKTLVAAFVGVLSLWLSSAALAHAPSGAIFTTVADGSEVNFNHYAAKTDVYLDGGPGPGAPQTAAGLDDGTYVFQVTDPSGKTLLSTDKAINRRFTVADGIITGVLPPGHVTGDDLDHGAKTVQLYPFNDTPNPGGVYKVWVVRIEDFELGVAEFGLNLTQGLDTVDVGVKPGNKHGFIPSHCKTDNFKVRERATVEIDTRFYDSETGEILDGLGVTWIDTLGGTNQKHSYWAPNVDVYHEAHVEAVEVGTHVIVIQDGPGYTINKIYCPDGTAINGAGEVKVVIKSDKKDLTIYIDVEVDLLP
jgi:hypothetical protein